ncbi:MAG: phage holin family protein [Labilithrix sp.]|nr:phage holin family protein [Labilithrix sp.]MCW5815591.1 phage holin family protein [Labilithrix sp.]
MDKRVNKMVVPPPERLAIEEASTVDLVKEALDEAKELVRLEVELAKTEIDEEIARAKKAAVGFALAGAFGVLALCMLAVALVLALGGTPLTAIAVAGGFLLVAGLGVALGYSVFPKKPLAHTRARLESDLEQLKEHLA